MKKILNIIAQRPDKTGSGIYLQSLVKEADKKNYRQAVIAGISSEDNDIYFDTKEKVQFYPVVFNNTNIPFSIVGMSDVMPYKSTKYKDLTEDMFIKWENAFSIVLKQAIDEFNPDIIICHHIWILTALVKKLYPNKNIIAFCHGTDLRQLKSFKNNSSNFSKKIIKFVIKNCSELKTIIVSHKAEQKEVIKLYNVNKNIVKIAGTGFNPDIFYKENSLRNHNFINIVYAGKLSYSKGVISLIKSIDLLKKYHKNLNLYIAGSGSGEEAYNILELCKHKNFNFKIHILGSISQKDLGNIFRKCDLFILPSFYEGLPLVVIESMACGLKVVCTDLPGIKEWMGNTINESGIINYVSLPELKDIDIPLEKDLPNFEIRLSKSIKHQIHNSIHWSNELNNAIKNKSWKSAFESIETLFN